MAQKLNQVLAVEQGLKSRLEDELTQGYKTLQKGSLFDGMSRIYRPLNDQGEKLPAEHKKVQQRAPEILKETMARLSVLFDITATKDFANCQARADVVVDGAAILKDVPATYLLFLEKYLVHVRTVVEKLPTLDQAETWVVDENDGLYKTAKIEKARTQKIAKGLVLYQATEQHPAQTQLVNEDVIVGYYEEVKQSGAFPMAEQKRLLLRVEKLQAAVKSAREAANMVEAPQQEVSGKVFAWIFGTK